MERGPRMGHGKLGRNGIVFVVGSLHVGGAESQLVLLAEQLSLRGWSVEVFAMEGHGQLSEKLKLAHIPVIDGGFGFKSNSKLIRIMKLARCEMRLLMHLVRKRPSVIHGFLPLTNFLAAVSGKIAFIPMIVTSRRALGTHQDIRPVFRFLDRIANSLSDKITANSIAVALDVERRDGYPSRDITVIRNGIDLSHRRVDPLLRVKAREKLGLTDTDIAVVQVANLIPYKGHRESIEAIKTASKSFDRIKLLFVGGDSGIQYSLEALARDLDVSDKIQFLGQRSDVAEILVAADIGILPSHEEGSSNALIEKLYAGLPVVATDVGGNTEAIVNMPGCVLVKVKDSADLARGLIQVINQGRNDDERSSRQNQILKRHSVEDMVGAYEKLYLSGG
jgi:glycosyltransferase involved in cell wall biosynthesis